MRNFLIISTVLLFGSEILSEIYSLITFRTYLSEFHSIPSLSWFDFFPGLLFSCMILLFLFIDRIRFSFALLIFCLSYVYILYREFFFTSIDRFSVEILEHCLKLSLPIISFLFLTSKISIYFAKQLLGLALALTFIGHGLYASGLIVDAKTFVYIIEKVTQEAFYDLNPFLYFIAISDILVGLFLLFIPKIRKITLLYMIVWSSIAMAARILAFTPNDFNFIEILKLSSIIIWRLIYIATPLYLLKTDIRLNRNKGKKYHKDFIDS